MKNSQVFQGLSDKLVPERLSGLKTPCYVMDEARFLENAKILSSVMKHTGCKILLAQKAFSNYDLYPLLSQYLSGTESSGLYEARLGAEEMPDIRRYGYLHDLQEQYFNGMPLPDIYKISPDGGLTKLTDFGYRDFKMRLGSPSKMSDNGKMTKW